MPQHSGSATSRRELADRIELGQVIVGGPDTVLAQVRRIRDELGAGILDLVVGVQLGERDLAFDRAVRHESAAAHAGALKQ